MHTYLCTYRHTYKLNPCLPIPTPVSTPQDLADGSHKGKELRACFSSAENLCLIEHRSHMGGHIATLTYASGQTCARQLSYMCSHTCVCTHRYHSTGHTPKRNYSLLKSIITCVLAKKLLVWLPSSRGSASWLSAAGAPELCRAHWACSECM